MNKKFKLLAILATFTTLAAEPITRFIEKNISNCEQKNTQQHNNTSQMQDLSNKGYSLIDGEGTLVDSNTTPFIGYVNSNYDDKTISTFDNGSYTTISNSNYLVVPYWNTTTNRAHYDSFASYTIDPNTKQLTILNTKMNLGYDVTNKVILQPQLVGDSLVTFFRDWNPNQPYGTGEWMVGVTNLNTGEATTYSLASATGKNTNNNRNNYIMVDNSNPNTPSYYLATFQYNNLSDSHIIVSKLNDFNPWNRSYNVQQVNDVLVDGANGSFNGTTDVNFGNGFATPKHEYQSEANSKNPLFGWTNLLKTNQASPIKTSYATYSNARGYWLFQTENGLVFANFGDNGGKIGNLQMGIINSDNEAIVTASYSFSTTAAEYSFYNGSSISISFYKGIDNTYYLLPSGVKSNNPNISNNDNSRYFAFDMNGESITNLNSYESSFFSQNINYVASTGKDLIINGMDFNSNLVSQNHLRTKTSIILSKFISFFSSNLYFVDLTQIYNSSATAAQKTAIENVAAWLGKTSDYTFAPMTINDMTSAATANLPDSVTENEMDQTISDFINVQADAIQLLLQQAYAKWIQTIEGTENGHQWGWYNENNLSNMFPAYVLDSENGLTYNSGDLDVRNPKVGLQNLLTTFHQQLIGGNPVTLIAQYLNPSSGSAIEAAFNEYKTWGSYQLNYFIQQIYTQMNSFYYGFADEDPNNNVLWNYYLDSSWNPVNSVNDIVNKWKTAIQDQWWSGMSVVHFFLATKVWANLTVANIAGINAVQSQFPFEYTLEFQTFRDINLNTFNGIVNDFYDSFLSTQYYGYPDPSSTFDVSGYFSGSSLQLITKDQFINKFSHTSTTYFYFGNFYTYVSGSERYDAVRTLTFTNYVSLQQTQLLTDIQNIINSVNGSYFGLITKTFASGFAVTDIDKLLANYSQNQELNAQDIANTITPSVLPTGLTNISQLHQFFTQINSSQISTFISNQSLALNNVLYGITNLLSSSYYGYMTSGLQNNSIYQTILCNFPADTALTESVIYQNFVSGLNNGTAGFPNKYNVLDFLANINNLSTDYKAFCDDQKSQLADRFVTIINWISPSYYGFDPLESNDITKYVLVGQQPNVALDPQALVNNFLYSFPNQDPKLPGIWAVNSFFSNLTETGSETTAWINDQNSQLSSWYQKMFDIFNPSFYGYVSNLDDSDATLFAQVVLAGIPDGTKLDCATLISNIKINAAKNNGENNFPPLYAIRGWIFSDVYSTWIEAFVTEQTTKLNSDIQNYSNTFINSYWGYLEAPIPSEIKNIFLDGDDKIITNNQVISRLNDWAENAGGKYNVYTYLNSKDSGNIAYAMNKMASDQKDFANPDLTMISSIIWTNYCNADFTFRGEPELFVGEAHIWTFFTTNGNTTSKPPLLDQLYDLFKTQIGETDITKNGTDYSGIASWLKTLYNPNCTAAGELDNWVWWENNA